MISGTKAYYGHPLGASAAIEGIICSLALQHGRRMALLGSERRFLGRL